MSTQSPGWSRPVAIACGLAILYWAGTGGADTAPNVAPNAAPAHACVFGPDPNPAGVSCNNLRPLCILGTPNQGQACNVAADCGRMPPTGVDCSISVGTCGALAESRGRKFLLSNNHVLGRVNLAERLPSEVVHLRSSEVCPCGAGACDASRPVGIFWKLKRLHFGPTSRNRMDAATANISVCAPGTPNAGGGCTVDGDCGNAPPQPGDCGAQRVRPDGFIQDIGIPTSVNGRNGIRRAGLERILFNNVVVAKSGRTTGCTQGTLQAVNATVAIGPYPNGQTAKFREQLIIAGPPGRTACRACIAGTPNAGQPCALDADCGRAPPAVGDCAPAADPVGTVMGAPGDSGSLVVTWDRRIVDGGVVHLVPVGLLFAANTGNSLAIASPIRSVLRKFGLTIVGRDRPKNLPIIDG